MNGPLFFRHTLVAEGCWERIITFGSNMESLTAENCQFLNYRENPLHPVEKFYPITSCKISEQIIEWFPRTSLQRATKRTE